VVAEGTPADLKKLVAEQRLDLLLADAAAFDAAADRAGARAVSSDPGRLTLSVPTDGTATQVRALLDELDPGHSAVRSFSVHTATLDDVFLALTGQARPGPATTPADQETTRV
jgi:ABC-2 type transport system ATP-binding protein